MSVQPEEGQTGGGRGGRGGRILGLPKPVVYVGGLAALAATAYLVWRSRQQGQQAQDTTAATPDTTDYSGEFATLETQLQGLQQEEAAEPAPTGTGAPPPPGGGGTKPGAVGNLHLRSKTSHSVTVAWNRVAGATGYHVTVTYQSKQVRSSTTVAQHATVDGLQHNHTYGIHVAAVNAAGQGPAASISEKTS